jgi:hypothetical protein
MEYNMNTKKQMSVTTIFLVLITLLFINIQIVFSARDKADPNNVPVPKIKLHKKNFDFGHVYGGTKITAKIEFTNEGNAPLEITKVKPSCGCMVSKLTQKTYQPGESGIINLDYKTKNRSGISKGYVIITSNDPIQPKVRVELKVNITQLVETTPSHLIFSNLDVGQNATKSIHVTTKKPLLLEASFKSTQQNNIKVEIEPKKASVTEKGTDFNVTVTPLAIGRFSGNVVIKAKQGLENPIEYNVSLVVTATGPVIAAPQNIYFSVVEGKAKDRTLSLSSKDPNAPLVIENLSYDKELLDIKVDPAEDNSTIKLLVSLKPKVPSETKSQTSQIKVEAKTGTELTNLSIPVRIYKRRSRSRQTRSSKQNSPPKSKPDNPPPKNK